METRWESVIERGSMNKLQIYGYLNVDSDEIKTQDM